MQKIKLGAILNYFSSNGFISRDLKDALILADNNGLCDDSSPLVDRDWILTDDRKLAYIKYPLAEEAEVALMLRSKCSDKDAAKMLLDVYKDYLQIRAKQLLKGTMGDVAYADIDDCKQNVVEVFLNELTKNKIYDNGHIIRANACLEYKISSFATKNITNSNIKVINKQAINRIKNYIKTKNLQDAVIKVSKEAVRDAADTLYKSGKISICDPEYNPDRFAKFIEDATNYINNGIGVVSGDKNIGQDDESGTTLFDTIASDAKSTEDAAIDNIVNDMFIDSNSPSLVMRAMAQFGDSRDIQVFVDVKVQGLSHKEIMAKYNISDEAIKSILKRTAKRIRETMQLMDAEETAIIAMDRGAYHKQNKNNVA